MVIRGDTLFVADKDCVRIFRRGTGAPDGSVCPSGAQELYGLAVDAEGVLWASDGGGAAGDARGGTIYEIGMDGSARAVLQGD
jgi:sugar lactone lactonase YvrE